MEEQEIIAGCLQNNPFAQRYLFDRNYRRSYHVAMRYLANHHDTEDVLSISFTRIFKNIGQFEIRGEGSLSKWINTIVINESIRFLKSKKELLFQEEECMENFSLGLDGGSDLLDLEEVAQVMGEMPKGYRTVFNLFAIEGYSQCY
ncbi:RNA polymerase sigma factor [Lunatimonas salinarum]|uniref:RNA polymerase sigma factor n=1 Tax=Lunatimonas salinarum TaxID=1774590 RepID=UPI001ADEF2B5|nr:sigma-70 family RNA polymerase sigma factor [Lunatimonas salinarum]